MPENLIYKGETMVQTKKRKKREHPLLYLLPTFVILTLLVAYPLVNNLINSFSQGEIFPTVKITRSCLRTAIFGPTLRIHFSGCSTPCPLRWCSG